jgi:hypothetical protein
MEVKMNTQTQEALEIQTKYKILCAGNIRDLEKDVNHHLKNGWKLTGGIAFGAKFCGQPMIKRLDK